MSLSDIKKLLPIKSSDGFRSIAFNVYVMAKLEDLQPDRKQMEAVMAMVKKLKRSLSEDNVFIALLSGEFEMYDIYVDCARPDDKRIVSLVTPTVKAFKGRQGGSHYRLEWRALGRSGEKVQLSSI